MTRTNIFAVALMAALLSGVWTASGQPGPPNARLWRVGVEQGSRAAQPPAPSAATQSKVTKQQFDEWMTKLSNWGRWGKDDERGALNLITAEKRRQAGMLVKTARPCRCRGRLRGRSLPIRRSRDRSTRVER
jgi:hypothetical protein